LSGKAVHHGLNGIGLVGLGFEFELHGIPFCSLSALLSAKPDWLILQKGLTDCFV
jgi:hypothetical protein